MSKVRSQVSQALAGFGALIGSRMAKPKKKKAVRGRKRLSGGGRPRPNSTVAEPIYMNTEPQTLSARVIAPVSSGGVYRSSRRANHVISVPFSSLSNSNVASNSVSGSGFGVTATSTQTFYDLGPFDNTVGGFQSFPFGIGVSNIARAYSRFRIKKLMLTYVPMVPSSTPGIVAIGATAENFNTVAPSVQQVTDCQSSILTPVWSEASIDLTSVARLNDGEWLYCYRSGSTVAEQRQNYCCTLMSTMQGIGTQTSANQNYGYLRFDGVIEFTSLSDIIGGSSLAHPQPLLAPNSEECKQQEMPVGNPQLIRTPTGWYSVPPLSASVAPPAQLSLIR